jgi:hypothetical protein
MEVPAELLVCKERFGKYSWAVYQPDTAGDYYSGVESCREEACKKAAHYLAVVHRKQGY